MDLAENGTKRAMGIEPTNWGAGVDDTAPLLPIRIGMVGADCGPPVVDPTDLD